MSLLSPSPSDQLISAEFPADAAQESSSLVSSRAQSSWYDSGCAWLIQRTLRRLKHGALRLTEGREHHLFGDNSGDLHPWIQVHRPRFYRRLVWGGGLGAAEALLDGDWSCDDLVSFVRLFIRNLSLADEMNSGLGAVRNLLARWEHAWKRNSVTQSRKNIEEHYDLSNDFFQLFLDDTMAYSSGVFTHAHATMREASLAKFERVCQKLELSSPDHLLEIGSGWGGLALYAAKHFGCRVTTVTISPAQFDLVRQRVRAAGLENRIEVKLADYRTLSGQFDKLVSIEMIEAVGHEYFDTFFGACSRLLKPTGRAVLQAITMKDQRYAQHLRSVDFIRKYIFPGGCLPSITAMLDSMTRASSLRLAHLEELTPHYALTLNHWRGAFWKNIDSVRTLGFSERFIRMWDYYFAYCEAAFLERQVGLVQMVLAREQMPFDPSRWLATTPRTFEFA